MDKKQHLDLVTLVNSQDEVIGEMDKVAAHRGDAQLHRAISAYLFRKYQGKIQLLIQQRSGKKIVGANWWANTCCGNVRPIENYEQCALRRLEEELGITTAVIQQIHKFEYHLRCNEEFSEWEIDQIFAGWYDDTISPNPDEVQDYRWIDWAELLAKNSQVSPTPSLFNSKTIQLADSSKVILAPWFVYMLDHSEITQALTAFFNTNE